MHWTRATILRRIDLGHGYFLLDIDEPEMARGFVAGQFVMLHREEGDFPLLPRPFSACDLLYGDRDAPVLSPDDVADGASRDPFGMRLMIHVMGKGTASLSRMDHGDSIEIWGPLGNHFRMDDAIEHAIFIAGGIGLAPFPILSRHLRARHPGLQSATLLYGARSARDLIYRDELEQLGIDVRYATDDGSEGLHGTSLDLLRDELRKPGRDTAMLYGCGPEPMLDALARFAVAGGYRCEVSMERMMGCGVGACLACVVPVKADYADGYLYEKTCIEGPVVDVNRMFLAET